MTGEIRLRDVRKVYRRLTRRGRLHSLKGALVGGALFGRQSLTEGFVAIDGIDLDIAQGEAVALVGPNGSGKSTLLKLISGILSPTEGTIDVSGRVTALIELGAGFHPEITGRENALINGMLLGLSRSEVEARMDDIARFAEIGEFFDLPVKTYSSGMYVRLGFSVAVMAEPDVLLVDEVLAVGDESFTRRCLDRIARMRRRGVTMVIVSHDLDLVMQLADRAAYLERGRVRMLGESDAVVARYRSDAADVPEPVEGTHRVRVVEEGQRWGTGDVVIEEVGFGSGGRELSVIPSGSDCTVSVQYRMENPVKDVVVGLAWHRDDGVHVAGHNTALDEVDVSLSSDTGEIRCVYPALELAPGRYFVDAAIHASDGLAYDYWCRCAEVRVTAPVDWPGVIAPRHRWEGDGVAGPSATE